ncbi:TIGR02587 family membrane protein [Chelatococcus sambhunathii]|uniref:TIGR02587 family membrane protein n=1 Tax=Chelatococcus sambhunathii TaxID=363953 RepID=A0ABU1DKK1_9HYPH|nr:TIGR02587 family membrane protein [Chelatococcus sambhunathii]MDR4308601.1 TIGR02587 family membrane protein [Chelatococcus sambhunathii]
MTAISADRRREIERGFLVELGRAAGGAVIFSLPVMMTMETWALGAGMDRARLLALFAAFVPMLVGLSHYVGFEETQTWLDDLRDAFVAIAVGFVVSALVLSAFGVLHPGLSLGEITGAVALQTISASFGAVIAQGQFGQRDDECDARARGAGYGGQLLFMASGAVFLSLNIAPTEEVELISASMTPLHALLLAAFAVLAMHAIVYRVNFVGQSLRRPEGRGFVELLLGYTAVGYAIALAVSAGLLWSFGSLEELAPATALRHVVTLGFPAGIGAAFARILVGGGD